MRRRWLAFLLPLAVAPGELPAQTRTVFPSDHATHEGSTSTSENPLSAGVARFQLLYSNWDLRIPNGARITRVGFRADAEASATGRSLQMEIQMGESDRRLDTTTAGLSPTFANNYLGTPTTVFARRIVALPNLTPSTPGPSGQVVFFTLDAPWVVNTSSHLVVDFFVHANNAGNSGFAYPIDVPSYRSTTRTIGAACTTSHGQNPALSSQLGAQLGGWWYVNLATSLPNSPGLLILGTNATNSGGVPLPFSLGPLGAPSCSWLVELGAALDARTSASGGYSIALAIPRDLVFHGRSLYAQHMVLDIFANNLGVVTSNGLSSTVGALPQAGMVRTSNTTTATSGSRFVEYGFVTVFEWQ